MELDNSTFQLVTMALLGITLLVLVMTLVSLSKLGKKVDEGLASRPDPGPQPEHGEEVQQQRLEAAPQEERARQAEPEEEAPAAEEPVAQSWGYRATPQAEPVAQRTAAADAGSSAPPSEQREDTAAQAGPSPEPQPEAATSFANAPEEQPFEHQGRWWFKRGDELLVYDEQSGQWEPAPAEGMGHTAAEQPQGEARQPESAAPQQAADQPPEEAAQGTFWKCPSCGAVNGSTAAACRMCFTPRP
ncbi:MAG: hypothetical protein ACRDK3_06410 [Actinomycetota bacterium]